MTFQLGKPIPWENFKRMPTDVQKEYLTDIIQRYSATASDFARLFGVTAATVARHCGNEGLGVVFSPGKRMPKDKRAEFEKLFAGAESQELVPSPAAREPAERPPVYDIDMSGAAASSGMDMTDFSLCFQGTISPEAVTNSIIAMLRPGANVRLEIKCSILP